MLVVVLVVTRGSDTTPPTTVVPALHAEIGLPDDAVLGFGMGAPGVDRNLLALSPDGGSIGFVTLDKLKRVAPNGDGLRTIAPIKTVVGGQWVAYGSDETAG